MEAKPNAGWLVDLVQDQLASVRRVRILKIVDDVGKECLAAVADTSVSGRRIAWEFKAIVATLRGQVAELAERGMQVDYRTVWEFVHAEGLSHKERR